LNVYLLMTLLPLSFALKDMDDGLEVLWIPVVSAGMFAIVYGVPAAHARLYGHAHRDE
jgi:hypothetical protein